MSVLLSFVQFFCKEVIASTVAPASAGKRPARGSCDEDTDAVAAESGSVAVGAAFENGSAGNARPRDRQGLLPRADFAPLALRPDELP